MSLLSARNGVGLGSVKTLFVSSRLCSAITENSAFLAKFPLSSFASFPFVKILWLRFAAPLRLCVELLSQKRKPA
jgi:hypothetical protein